MDRVVHFLSQMPSRSILRFNLRLGRSRGDYHYLGLVFIERIAIDGMPGASLEYISVRTIDNEGAHILRLRDYTCIRWCRDGKEGRIRTEWNERLRHRKVAFEPTELHPTEPRYEQHEQGNVIYLKRRLPANAGHTFEVWWS